jgi:hypothetical protein
VVYASDDELGDAIEAGREQLRTQCFVSSLERLGSATRPPDGFGEPCELRVPDHAIWVALQRLAGAQVE